MSNIYSQFTQLIPSLKIAKYDFDEDNFHRKIIYNKSLSHVLNRICIFVRVVCLTQRFWVVQKESFFELVKKHNEPYREMIIVSK